MKKILKVTALLLVFAALAGIFCSCKSAKKKLAGTWDSDSGMKIAFDTKGNGKCGYKFSTVGIFSMDPMYLKTSANERLLYKYSQLEKYGYCDYVNYKDWLNELLEKGEIDEAKKAEIYISREAAKDSEEAAEYVKRFTENYESQGYTVERLDAKMVTKTKVRAGGQQQLFAYKKRSILTRICGVDLKGGVEYSDLTYKIKGGSIELAINNDGQTVKKSFTYKIENDTLSLTYGNETETFKRSDEKIFFKADKPNNSIIGTWEDYSGYCRYTFNSQGKGERVANPYYGETKTDFLYEINGDTVEIKYISKYDGTFSPPYFYAYSIKNNELTLDESYYDTLGEQYNNSCVYRRIK